MAWYFKDSAGAAVGPLETAAFRACVQSGSVRSGMLVSRDGAVWKSLKLKSESESESEVWWRRVLRLSRAVFIGLAIVFAVMVIAIVVLVCESSPSEPPSTGAYRSTAALEQAWASALAPMLDQSKQALFDGIHPTGQAKRLVLHDAAITAWKRDNATDRAEDVVQVTLRYTLYWEGPITTDGYTKIEQIYDAESRRLGQPKILATNGITNEQLMGAAFQLGGTILANSISDQ